LTRRPSGAAADAMALELARRPSHLLVAFYRREARGGPARRVCAAAGALARLGDRAGTVRLGQLVRQGGEAAIAAIDELLALGDADARALVESTLDGTDAAVIAHVLAEYSRRGLPISRQRLVRILERPMRGFGDVMGTFQHVRKLLGSEARATIVELLLAGRVVETAAALAAIATPPDQALLPVFARFLGDARAPVREAALDALAELDARGLVEVFVGMVEDPEPGVRLRVATVLARIDGPIPCGGLVVLSKDTDSTVRAAACRALGRQDQPPVVAALRRRLRDDDPEVVIAALIALCDRGRYEDVDALFERVDDAQVGATARAYLERRFERRFETAGAWREWWRVEGKFLVDRRKP